MLNSLPKRHFMDKAKDAIGTVLAVPVVRAHKKIGDIADKRRIDIQRGRKIPDRILSVSNEKDPAFRAKVNAIQVKKDILFENKRLRAKWPK